jgi:hypothetical protein
MIIKRYCVMAHFSSADDNAQSYTVFLEAGSEDEARQLGRERIAAKMSPESSWDGEVVVYGEEQFDMLRQLGILPRKASPGEH